MDPAEHAALLASVQLVAEPWRDSAYYGEAERWTPYFWNGAMPFRRYFDQLDLDVVIDLAAGYGRHAEMAAPLCRHLILMDVIAHNLKICRVRLAKRQNISYLANNGYDFQPLPAAAISAIYCYDAMVHFSPEIVAAYLADSARVLRPGGRALFHHSNYDGPPAAHYGQNPHARNHMTAARFAGLAAQAGLAVLESELIPWGGLPELDGITLLERPA